MAFVRRRDGELAPRKNTTILTHTARQRVLLNFGHSYAHGSSILATEEEEVYAVTARRGSNCDMKVKCGWSGRSRLTQWRA